MLEDEAGKVFGDLTPEVFPVNMAQAPTGQLSLSPSEIPLKKLTLGALGVATQVTGPDELPAVILRQPFDSASLTGIDARTVRVFRADSLDGPLRPVWDSGINLALGFVWSRITRPGIYAPLGLPRDRLLSEMLRVLAQARCYRDPQTPEESWELVEEIFKPYYLEPGKKELKKIEELRELLTHLEIATSPGGFLPGEIRLGRDAIPEPFPLPGGASLEDLKHQLTGLKVPPAGLPEEKLFFPPEGPAGTEPPWLILPQRAQRYPLPTPVPGAPLPTPWPPLERALPEDRVWLDPWRLDALKPLAGSQAPAILGWLFPRDWWMHHRDAEHTGAAQCSAIRRTNAGTLRQRRKICLEGPIVSMPCIVAGKIYVGTSSRPLGIGGTLYKIDLATGVCEASFSFSDVQGDWRAPHAGVGSSPAVTGGKVYFSALTGKVYCLDAGTLACSWITNLRHRDLAQNQPVEHRAAPANGWSSPLVVNDRVYVGFGEGENNTFGFVYCLDAANGKVIWLFCTNRFKAGVDNRPNVIPPAMWLHRDDELPKMFTKAARNPKPRGASPWSSPCYCAALDRIYIGTGNAVRDNPLPDPRYASGLLSLDAATGGFKGYFQPAAADNYRKKFDFDVDVPAGPMVFTRKGTHYVCFGSKGGSLFLLDAATMKVKARRQLLPRNAMGGPLLNVDPPDTEDERENKSGVFGTAALAAHLGRIFVGLGGHHGARMLGIDSDTTPFIRAVDWDSLEDAWPTTGTNPPRYSVAKPPVYTHVGESGLSSPAVVNDVVFVSTTLPALYAFDAETGLCLWQAPGIAAFPGSYALGPAIYGNFVVNGLSNGNLYIYSL